MFLKGAVPTYVVTCDSKRMGLRFATHLPINASYNTCGYNTDHKSFKIITFYQSKNRVQIPLPLFESLLPDREIFQS
jgi:hypothetical protein